MTMTRPQAIRAVEEFLLANQQGLGQIDPDLELLHSRVLDSLQFMNLIFLIEELTETPVEFVKIEMRNFTSLRHIAQHFFGELPDAA